jgi:hypothetical protein
VWGERPGRALRATRASDDRRLTALGMRVGWERARRDEFNEGRDGGLEVPPASALHSGGAGRKGRRGPCAGIPIFGARREAWANLCALPVSRSTGKLGGAGAQLLLRPRLF